MPRPQDRRNPQGLPLAGADKDEREEMKCPHCKKEVFGKSHNIEQFYKDEGEEMSKKLWYEELRDEVEELRAENADLKCDNQNCRYHIERMAEDHKGLKQLEAENKRLREFLEQLDMCEIRGESVLLLKPAGEIFKDIKPRPRLEDSVILLTCASHSTPELFLKMVKSILTP